MNKSIRESIKLSELFNTKGDQNEYLENLCYRYIVKYDLKKAIESIDIIVHEECKLIWVQAILENLSIQKTSFENIKPLMNYCMKYPNLLSEILVKHAAYNCFYAPKANYKMLYSLKSVYDINDLLCFFSIKNFA